MDLTLRQCAEDLNQTDTSGKVNNEAEENDTDNAQQEFRSNKQKTSIEGAVDVALHNIYECAEAMSLDAAINTALEENLFSNAPAMFNVEDSYLSLASASTADGIFYCLIMKIDFSDKTYYVARYFEYGTFTGFYQYAAHEKIKEQIDCIELLPYCVYTEQDISLEKRRDLKLFAERRAKGNRDVFGTQSNIYGKNERQKWHGFRRSIFGNKTGVQESFKKVLPEFDAAGIICPFVISLCLRKKPKRYKNVCPELNKQRYCICYPQSVSEEWENMLMAFRSSPTNKDKTGTSSLVSKKHTQLSMEDQFSVLSILPNHHKWQWKEVVKSVRLEQRLSSTRRYYPGSPRNRIIQAFCFRDDFREICNQCVKNILGDEQAVPNYAKRKCKSHSSQRNKKRRLENLSCGVKGKKSSSAMRNVKDRHTKSTKPKSIINGSNEAVWLNQVEITKRKVVHAGLWGLCDVVLIVEHEDYYVQKEILTDASPVFKVMLESEIFRDKILKKIELPGKKGKDILQLLNCLYPHGSKISENTDITSLLDLSREYKIQTIKDRCEVFLLSKEPTVRNLVIAQDYGLPNLLEKCISYFSEKALLKIEEDTNFKKVSEANQIRIMKNQRNKLQDYSRRTQDIIFQMNCQSNRRPKCDKNVQHCANNDSAAVLKLEEWKKNLCSNCKLHNSRKEKLYYNCKAEKDSLGYG